jgi:hypothetical protein
MAPTGNADLQVGRRKVTRKDGRENCVSSGSGYRNRYLIPPYTPCIVRPRSARPRTLPWP